MTKYDVKEPYSETMREEGGVKVGPIKVESFLNGPDIGPYTSTNINVKRNTNSDGLKSFGFKILNQGSKVYKSCRR